jgi:hypothetical protein
VNPAELFLIGLAAAGSVWALVGYARASRARREARRRERQGARNAANAQRELLGEHAADGSELCVICHGAVNPDVDLFDEKSRGWWHRDCWREALR